MVIIYCRSITDRHPIKIINVLIFLTTSRMDGWRGPGIGLLILRFQNQKPALASGCQQDLNRLFCCFNRYDKVFQWWNSSYRSKMDWCVTATFKRCTYICHEACSRKMNQVRSLPLHEPEQFFNMTADKITSTDSVFLIWGTALNKFPRFPCRRIDRRSGHTAFGGITAS